MLCLKSFNEWQQFIGENKNDDFLFFVVFRHENKHSAINEISILFIRNLSKGISAFYSKSHPDISTVNSAIENLEIINLLNSIRGNKWTFDKKAFLHVLPVEGLLDVGMIVYLNSNKTFEISEFETSAHTFLRRNRFLVSNFSDFVPLEKHKEVFSDILDSLENKIKAFKIDDSFKQFNFSIIEPLSHIEKYGLQIDPKKFLKHFGQSDVCNERVYTQYNIYTSTGRPSNRFGGINYAALNKEDGSREVFISRFGKSGKLVLIDYSAFHPRIIAYLTHYPLDVKTDIYEYLAKLYFNKSNIDESDISDSKKITFRQLYGGVESKYSHIKYLSHLDNFIKYYWSYFNEHGYIETPIFKRKISKKHIQNPKPATIFNYLLQAVEGEISIPVLGNVNKFLENKNTKPILYTYDSILFDYCIDDGSIMTSIKDMLSLNGTFPMKWYAGDDYQNMELIS